MLCTEGHEAQSVLTLETQCVIMTLKIVGLSAKVYTLVPSQEQSKGIGQIQLAKHTHTLQGQPAALQHTAAAAVSLPFLLSFHGSSFQWFGVETMEGTRAVLMNGGNVLSSGVSLVGLESIEWIVVVCLEQELIVRHLGQNRG